MRIWLVPFRELDNQRVLGQHAEWHAIEKLIMVNGTRWKGWENHLGSFVDLHGKIVSEMSHRGYRCQTPPMWDLYDEIINLTSGERYNTPYQYKQEDIENDRWELVCRCEGKWLGRGEIPPEWEPHLERYFAQGCDHGNGVHGTEKVMINGCLVDLCLTCKLAYAIETVNPSGRIWIPLPRKVVVGDLR